MRKLKIFHQDQLVGTLACPDSYRPPISQTELDAIPAFLIGRSRSWLYEVRSGDLRLELRGDGQSEEVVIVATPRLGSGDIGCLIGFEPATAEYAADEAMLKLADDVLHNHGSTRRC